MLDEGKAKRTLFTADARFAATPKTGDAPDRLGGYALVWNTLSDDRGGYKVRLMPGSAKFTPIVHAIYHHEFNNPLGVTSNGTLRLVSDDIGVKFEIDLPNTSLARDVFELVDKRYVNGMSFAMVRTPWSWTGTGPTGAEIIADPAGAYITTENGVTIVNATAYDIDEITITPRPAFVDTTVRPATGAGYAARTQQANQLQHLRFSSLKLAGHGIPRATK